MTIERAIARNADRQAGSNPSARHARGLQLLTRRPLDPPDEEVGRPALAGPRRQRPPAPPALADLRAAHLRPPGPPGAPGRGDRARPRRPGGRGSRGAQDPLRGQGGPRGVEGEQPGDADAAQGRAGRRRFAGSPGVFRAKRIRRSDATGADGPWYGYIRIFTFNVPSADAFVAEFGTFSPRRWASTTGWSSTRRGNGGGLIYAAEQRLQVLRHRHEGRAGARAVHQHAAEPANLSSTRAFAGRPGPRPGTVGRVARARRAHRRHVLSGIPGHRSHPRQADKQRYGKPSVLVTDPLSYSATDMFTAGFQDHRIGKVIGVGGTTGAGGANVWSHALLRRLMEPTADDPTPSPTRCSRRAVRTCARGAIRTHHPRQGERTPAPESSRTWASGPTSSTR